MKKKTIIFLVIFILVIILGLFLHFQYLKSTNTSVYNCPLLISEDKKFTVTADDCYQIRQQDGTPIIGSYGARKLLIASKDGMQKRTLDVNESNFSFESGLSVSETPDNKYVFLDTGTWVIHGAQVVSMEDTRITSVEYLHRFITSNGYLIFAPRSQKFINVHTEVDLSDAIDVKALKLSDFSIKTLCAGDSVYDCGIGDVSSDGSKLSILKTKWGLHVNKPEVVNYFNIK